MSEEGGAPAGAEGGEGAPSNVTDDGLGGKASMMTESGGEGEGQSSDDSGKLDMKALLGEELSGDRNISKFLESENPVQDMAKSLLEAQKQVGAPKVGIPGEQSTPEETSAFYKELGVPDKGDASEDGYNFTKPEGMPDEAFNQEHADKWAGKMKELNVPKETAAALREFQMTEVAEAGEVANVELNKQLDSAFGDNKDVVTKEIRALVEEIIPDQELRNLVHTSLDSKTTPAVALVLGKAMEHMKAKYGLADNNNNDEGEGQGGGKTVDEMRAEGSKLMASKAFTDGMDSGHDEMVTRVNALYADIGVLTKEAQKK